MAGGQCFSVKLLLINITNIIIICRSSKITVECVDMGLTALPADIDTSTQEYILFCRNR